LKPLLNHQTFKELSYNNNNNNNKFEIHLKEKTKLINNKVMVNNNNKSNIELKMNVKSINMRFNEMVSKYNITYNHMNESIVKMRRTNGLNENFSQNKCNIKDITHENIGINHNQRHEIYIHNMTTIFDNLIVI